MQEALASIFFGVFECLSAAKEVFEPTQATFVEIGLSDCFSTLIVKLLCGIE